MKKRILLVAVLQVFLVLNSCSSEDESTTPTEEIKGEITADYISQVSFTDDIVVNDDNMVYQIGQVDFGIELKKIDLEGKVTSVKKLNYPNFGESSLSTSKDGILLVAKFHESDTDKIFRFENNFSDLNALYTMKPISSPFANKIKLTAICNNNDNTYFVYDYNNKQMKRFVPELNTDVLVAGSEKNEIKDGIGLNASFGFVSKIISQNNVLYIIDNLYTGASSSFASSNIRKLEYVNNEWKVTTLISSTTDTYVNIAFDSQNDLYVLLEYKGISKLNLQNNTLSTFKDGELLVGKGTIHQPTSYKSITKMNIKGNDMYILLANSTLVKISDFQSKLSK